IGAAMAGDPPPTLSCTDVPGADDDVLTPRELATWRMDALRRELHVRRLARAAGYGFFRVEDALFRHPGFKRPFSLTQLLEGSQPYGPFMSLDDLHPNAAGHGLIARAALQALFQAYPRLAWGALQSDVIATTPAE
ncbi:MAG TPA: hypothetical protein VMJ30_04650, partial [Gemmatimonadales bacterium]|nr:hypothetical protein [Gemmatimonadales bacterium]